MFHVFSAELLGLEGDFSGAAAEYLEAALASDDPEIAQRAARVAVAADEWQMVALASDRWATLAPDNLDALQLAAGSRLREGDYAGAGFRLRRILEITAGNARHGWSIVAALLVPADDQSKASKLLDQLIQDFDAEDNADTLYARSQLAARGGDREKAMELADEAISLAPERSDLLAWSGRLAVSRKDEQKALQRYRQAWEADPADTGIAMTYAELLKRGDDMAAARAVLAALPDTADMRFNRIVFALDSGDREAAETLYNGYREAQYKDSATGTFRAAQSAELLGHPREAISWYKKVTGEHSMQAVMRQAFLLADIGEVGEARNTLAHIRIDTDPSVQSQSYQAEAQILQSAGRKDEAMQVLNGALDEMPADTSLRYARALLGVDMDRLDLAESDLRQIIAAEPENAAALNALGYTLADLTDRYDEAEQLIRKAYALQPLESSIVDSMGWVAYRLGRYEEAEKYLAAAWRMQKNAEIAAHLGEVLWASGQREKARGLWQEGLQTDPENEVLISTMHRFGVFP